MRHNLTALTSPRCPECGWTIDWQLAGADEERPRVGTTVISYWWFGVLATFVAMRARPRWVVVIFLVVPSLAAFLATQIGGLVLSALDLGD